MTFLNSIKSLVLPNRPVPCRVLRGPFRGARFVANPQHSLRYIFGVYEHELNRWTSQAVARTRVLFDVGANHGYFSFGVMAAWRRLRVSGAIVAFEPEANAYDCLIRSTALNAQQDASFTANRLFVGSQVAEGQTTLDAANEMLPEAQRESPKLVKIDVEGAEIDVLRGAGQLVREGNLFLIEAHCADLLRSVEEFFRANGHAYVVVHQHPLPLLGRETRDLENYWVVSRL